MLLLAYDYGSGHSNGLCVRLPPRSWSSITTSPSWISSNVISSLSKQGKSRPSLPAMISAYQTLPPTIRIRGALFQGEHLLTVGSDATVPPWRTPYGWMAVCESYEWMPVCESYRTKASSQSTNICIVAQRSPLQIPISTIIPGPHRPGVPVGYWGC